MASAELPCKLGTTAWSIHLLKARLAMDDSGLNINIHFYADAISCDLSKAGAWITARPRAVENVSTHERNTHSEQEFQENIWACLKQVKCVTRLFSFRTTNCSWCDSPYWVRASSLTRIHDHYQIHHTKISLDEWSARRTSTWQHKTYMRQTCTPPAGFKTTIPASERPQTHDLDRAVPGIGKTF